MMMQKLIVALVGLGLTIGTGVVFGHLTQRWGPAPDLLKAAERVENFPREIGEWEIVDEEPLSDNVVRMLDCAGSVSRRYMNRTTGDTLSLAVIVGPPGPTAVHTPEICYSSRDYKQSSKRRRITVTDDRNNEHSFWEVTFQSKQLSSVEMATLYAWRADTSWEASESPRFEFGGKGLLYKFQLATQLSPFNKSASEASYESFLKDLMNMEWNRSL